MLRKSVLFFTYSFRSLLCWCCTIVMLIMLSWASLLSSPPKARATASAHTLGITIISPEQLLIGKPVELRVILHVPRIPQRIQVMTPPKARGGFLEFRPLSTSLDFSKGSAIIGSATIVPTEDIVSIDSIAIECVFADGTRTIARLPHTSLHASIPSLASDIIQKGMANIVPYGEFSRSIAQDTIRIQQGERAQIIAQIAPKVGDAIAGYSIKCFPAPLLLFPQTHTLSVVAQTQIFTQENAHTVCTVQYDILSDSAGVFEAILAPQWSISSDAYHLIALPTIRIPIVVSPAFTPHISWFERWSASLVIAGVSCFVVLGMYTMLYRRMRG